MSVCPQRVLPTLDGNLPWMEVEVPTLDGGTYLGWGISNLVEVPSLNRGCLLWAGGTHHGLGVPTLDRGIYLGWVGCTYPG